jgi:type II secretory pathway predicted ATPase ExeA
LLSQNSRPSGKQSLLAKRLAGKHRSLTIYAAPYADQSNAVRTAPVRQYSDQQLLAPPIVQSQQKQIYPHQPQRPNNSQMKPFEDLFDTIEATRSLKENLDDQIRRASHIMNELHTTSIKQIVDAEMQALNQHIDSKLERLLTECSTRLSTLESKALSTSPSLQDLLNRIEKLESRDNHSK